MIKKNKIGLFIMSLATIVALLLSCERDDICADNVTPYLIIRFMDVEDPDTANDVVDLQIEYVGTGLTPADTTKYVFSSATTTDSITLLLPTFKNTATFRFIQNYDTETDSETGEVIDDLSDAEIDSIEFSYDPTEEYVNRACGFRMVYSDLEIVDITPVDGETATNGFINSEDIKNEIIDNEEEAHIYLLH